MPGAAEAGEPATEVPPVPSVQTTPPPAPSPSESPPPVPGEETSVYLDQLRQNSNAQLPVETLISPTQGSLLYPSVARTSLSRTANTQQTVNLNQPYNLRVGPVRLRFAAGVGIEANDNVNLSQNNRQADIILTPSFQADMLWQVTKLNTLRIDLGASYADYLIHPQYNASSISIAPGSQISFDLYVGDVRFNLHDTFSLQQDPASQSTANNVTTLGLFTNDLGLTGIWDLNNVILSLGYDLVNTLNTSPQGTAGYPNQVSNVVPASVTFPLSTSVKFGIVGDVNASSSSGGIAQPVPSPTPLPAPILERRIIAFRIKPPYPPTPVFQTITLRASPAPRAAPSSTPSSEQESHLGLFAEARLTRFITLNVVGGYQVVKMGGSGQTAGGSLNGYYGDLILTQIINRRMSQSLEIGHESTVGFDITTDQRTFISHAASFNIIKNVGLTTSLFAEDVTTPGTIPPEHLKRVGAGLSLSYQLMRKGTINAQYQFLYKLSNLPDAGYEQNRVLVNFGYQF